MTSQPHGVLPGRPERIGAYTLLSPLGEGGMGVVHLARHDGGRRVALKVLRPHVVGDEEGRRRLDREVASLRRVHSRWVAEVLDADPWAPVPYVATRYVPGLSLHDHVHREGPITDGRPGGDLTWCAAGLAEGVAAVHAAGVTHRDVKPSNVLLEGRSPILIDFGLARVADDPRLTHTGYLLGTPGYLAPEILYGEEATAASDVHSWAATVAFAATGRAPFGRGPAMAVMDRVRRGEHDLTGVPDPLRSLVAAALEPEPDSRPVLDDILGWLRPRAVVARPRDPAPAPAQETADVEDPFTVPLALVAPLPAATAPAGRGPGRPDEHGDDEQRDDGPDQVTTDFHPLAEERAPATRVYPELARPAPIWRPAPAAVPAPEHHQDPQDPQDFVDPWHAHPTYPADPPPAPREPTAVRLRRAALLAAGIALVGAALAAAPYLTAAVLVVAVVLLRGGSRAAEGVGSRRERRGRRWWDGPWALVSAPWHLVASLPSSLLLLLWGGGLALAAALVGYAVHAPLPLVLGPAGLVLAGSLWWGPGGGRVRSPLARAATPVVTGPGGFVVTLAVLLGAAVLLGLAVAAGPTDGVLTWTPARRRALPPQVETGAAEFCLQDDPPGGPDGHAGSMTTAPYPSSAPPLSSASDPVVSVRGLTKSYGGRRVVDDLHLEVHAGEVLGLIGANGAGKTTTVECLQGLRRPDAGTLRVLGLDPVADATRLQLMVGSQLQSSELPDRLRVHEAVRLFAGPDAGGPAAAEELLERFGLTHRRRSAFAGMSGGERQRLFLVLALLNRPRLVILDELTQGLDPSARREVWSAVTRLRDAGTTVLLVTHELAEAEALCDRVVALRAGRVLDQGRPAELVARHAGSAVVRFSLPAGRPDAHLRELAALPGAESVERAGDQVAVRGARAVIAHAGAWLVGRGPVPADLRVEVPDLESALLTLLDQPEPSPSQTDATGAA